MTTFVFCGFLTGESHKPTGVTEHGYVIQSCNVGGIRSAILFPHYAGHQKFTIDDDIMRSVLDLFAAGIRTGVWAYYQSWGDGLDRYSICPVIDGILKKEQLVFRDDSDLFDFLKEVDKLGFTTAETNVFDPFKVGFFGAHGF